MSTLNPVNQLPELVAGAIAFSIDITYIQGHQHLYSKIVLKYSHIVITSA